MRVLTRIADALGTVPIGVNDRAEEERISDENRGLHEIHSLDLLSEEGGNLNQAEQRIMMNEYLGLGALALQNVAE